MTEEQARGWLRRRVARDFSTQKEAAEMWRVSPAFLNDVLRGRRSVGDVLAKTAGLGVRRMYFTVTDAGKRGKA